MVSDSSRLLRPSWSGIPSELQRGDALAERLCVEPTASLSKLLFVRGMTAFGSIGPCAAPPTNCHTPVRLGGMVLVESKSGLARFG